MISHEFKITCPIEWFKRHVIMKSIIVIIPLMEFNICSLELKYVNWSYNKKIFNSMIGEIILMGW